jgi:vacuolar-type H+-ATPase subunit E/Vma4
MYLYREPDIISETRKGRLRWLRHVERMSEERTVKKVFKNTLQKKCVLESKERDCYSGKCVLQAGEK